MEMRAIFFHLRGVSNAQVQLLIATKRKVYQYQKLNGFYKLSPFKECSDNRIKPELCTDLRASVCLRKCFITLKTLVN